MIIASNQTELIGDWYECHLIVSRMSVDNQTNWRLPTIAELMSISLQDNDFSLSNYWSSEEDGEYALMYSFADSEVSRRVKTRVASVRGVRDE